MESRSSPGPATLRHHDVVIGSCRRAGFSVEMAAHAFSLLEYGLNRILDGLEAERRS